MDMRPPSGWLLAKFKLGSGQGPEAISGYKEKKIVYYNERTWIKYEVG